MYFITKKTSETGKRFQEVAEKGRIAIEASKVVAKEIGFEQWREGYWLAWGGFSSLIFKEKPNPKIYKEVNSNEYMPKLNTKEGKRIQALLDNTPRVSSKELNQCINFNHSFKSIGFAQNNDEYFGFTVKDNWNVNIPTDCEEITVSKYNELFPE